MTKAKIVSAALTASTALLSISSAAFATTVQVSGNGEDSGNTVNLEISRTVDIFQQNNASVNNDVNAGANTGNNEALDNTGGDVSINTGDATTKLSLSTAVNSNVNSGNCCEEVSVSAKIAGNGADSDNEINLTLNSENRFVSENEADIDNDLNLYANTGNNRANGNSSGDVTITTGNALIELVLTNKANKNEFECECGGKEDNEGNDKEVPGPGVVEVIPAAAAPVGQTLPMTGFDYQIIVLGSALATGAGALLKKGSRKLEELLSN